MQNIQVNGKNLTIKEQMPIAAFLEDGKNCGHRQRSCRFRTIQRDTAAESGRTALHRRRSDFSNIAGDAG